MQTLPMDPFIPQALERLRTHKSLIVTAPPGTGKTTRLPIALARDGSRQGQIWVLEPRRIAAHMAALRVSQEQKIRLGGEVGYAVRHEKKQGPDTGLLYLTQGLFIRRLLNSPELKGVSCVVLDEFHERHLDGDLALSVLAALQRGPRPDLRLVIMSATLNADPLLTFLPDAGHMQVEVEHYPVEVEHLPRDDDRPLDKKVAGALDRLWKQQQQGDTLVFVPGVADIERCRALLQPRCQARGMDLRCLHGGMSAVDQARSLRPGSRPSVLLSTNIAESSLTIEGVTAVIDSGLAKIAGHAAWSGLPTLATKPVAQDSCQQRSGRAGRLGPGRCLRLFTLADYQQRPATQSPEIVRSDLCGLVLATTHILQKLNLHDLRWLSPPPEAALQSARSLLQRLGALKQSSCLTERGRDVLRYPLHARLGRLVQEGRARGVSDFACAAATLLSEDQRRRGGPKRADTVRDCDLRPEVEALVQRRQGTITPSMRRSYEQLKRITQDEAPTGKAPKPPCKDPWIQLRMSLLAAFPDRVCARAGDERGLMLAQGGQAQLAESSTVRDAPLLIALHAVERRRGTRGGAHVLLASAIEADWLLDLFVDDIEERETLNLDGTEGRVRRRSQLCFGQIVIDEQVHDARGSEAAIKLLLDALLRRGLDALTGAAEIHRLARRVELCQLADLRLADFRLDMESVRRSLLPLAASCGSLAELQAHNLPAAIEVGLDPDLQAALREWTPSRLRLSNGKNLPVAYTHDAEPLLQGYIQDFFGLPTSPRLAGGRIDLRMQLQAPNRRGVQITTDLARFWAEHYPTLKKQLSRRYPRHHWPEDPAQAPPVLLKRQLGAARSRR